MLDQQESGDVSCRGVTASLSLIKAAKKQKREGLISVAGSVRSSRSVREVIQGRPKAGKGRFDYQRESGKSSATKGKHGESVRREVREVRKSEVMTRC